MYPTYRHETATDVVRQAALLTTDRTHAAAVTSQAAAEGLEFETTRVVETDHPVQPGHGPLQEDVGPTISTQRSEAPSVPDALGALAEETTARCLVASLRSRDVDRAFFERAGSIARSLPVVLHVAGDAGEAGSIGGLPADRVRSAAVQQAGLIPAHSLEATIDLAIAFSGLPPPTADGVAIVSNAGGPGVLAADAVGAESLTLATFDDETRALLERRIPDSGSSRNPVDVVGDAGLDRFGDTLDAVLGDPDVGAAIVLSAPSTLFAFEDLADTVVDVAHGHDQPIVTCFMGGSNVEPAAARARAAGIPNFFDPARAARSLAALFAHRESRSRSTETLQDWPRASTTWATRTDFPLDRKSGFALLDAVGIETTIPPSTDVTTVHVELVRTDEFGPIIALSIDEFEALVDDLAIRLAPITREQAEGMCRELRAAPILGGARGRGVIDTRELATTIHDLATTFVDLVPVDQFSVDLVGTPSGPAATTVRLAR